MNDDNINLLNPKSKKGSFPYAIRLISYFSAVVLTTIYVVYSAAGANTTIGNNISTNGTLTVGGTALFSGTLRASSTLQATGATHLFSTLEVEATTTLATTTIDNGDFTVSDGALFVDETTGAVAFGTTTGNPQAHFTITGSSDGEEFILFGYGNSTDTAGLRFRDESSGLELAAMKWNPTNSRIDFYNGSSGSTNDIRLQVTQSGITASGTLSVLSTTASSTFANGIQLTSGCFRLPSGACAGTGSGSGVVGSATLAGQVPYYASALDTLTATSTLFISSASRVGIGTTSPEGALGIVGDLVVDDSGSGTSTIGLGKNTGGIYDYLLQLVGADNRFRIYDDVAGQERFTITSGGDVGIGTTSPTEQLSLANRLYIGGTGTSTIENNLSVLGTLRVGSGSTFINSNSINFDGKQALSDNSSILEVGNDSSYTVTRLFGGGSQVLSMSSLVADWSVPNRATDGSAGTPSITFTNDNNTGFFSAASDAIGFSTGGSEKVRINSSGNVGIGTTTPDQLLTVKGNVSALLAGGPSPSLLGSSATGDGPADVYVSGRYAYVVNTNDKSLQIFDVSTSSPALVGSVSNGALGPVYVYVSGKYAYTLSEGSSGTANEFNIIDVSNPSNPILIGGTNTVRDANAKGLYVSGSYAYIGTSESLQIIDVSDSRKPKTVGIAPTIATSPSDVVVAGRYAYVSVNSTPSRLQIFDVSDPSSPISVGSVSFTGFAISLDVSGSYVYLVKEVTGSSDKLEIFNVANPGNPVSVGNANTSEFPRSVHVAGRYVYVGSDASEASDQFEIFDVSNPTSPFLTHSVTTGSVARVFVSGRNLYVANTNSDTLRIYDIGGLETTSALVHSLESGNLQVRNDILAQGQLQVTGGISAGNGGILSAGPLAISATTSHSSILGGLFIGTTTPATTSPNFTQFASSVVVIEATSSTAIPLTIRGAGTQTGNYFQIQDSANTNQLVLSSAGRLGIGTSSPSRLLSVHGNALFSGDLSSANLTATGSLTVSGSGTSTFGGPISSVSGNLYLSPGTSGANIIFDPARSGFADGFFIIGSSTKISNESLSVTAPSDRYAALGIARDGAAESVNIGLSAGNLIFNALPGETRILTLDLNDVRAGVGTTSPFANLSVNQDSGQVGFAVGSSTATNFIIDASGRVGIGALNPVAKLQVNSGNEGIEFDPAVATDQGRILFYDRTAAAFNTASYDALAHVFRISGSDKVNITSAGNVGIGTTTPSELLSVQGGALISGTTTVNGLLATSTIGIGTLNPQVNLEIQDSGAPRIRLNKTGVVDYNLGIDSNNVLHLASNNTNLSSDSRLFIINSSGNVGIGTVSPFDLLQVQKDQVGTTTITVLNDSNTDGAYANMRISVGGPSAGDPFLQWGISNGTRAYALGIDNSDSDKFKLVTQASSATTNLDDGTALLTVDTSGNVGVGTTTPSKPLSIQGNALFSGDLSLANLTATGTVTINDGSPLVFNSTAANTAIIMSNATGDTFQRLLIQADGRINLGPGNGGRDTNLYRLDANILATDDNFSVGTDLDILGGTLNIGTGSATSTLSSASGNLGIGTTTPTEQLSVANRLYVGGTGTSTIENNLKVLGNLQIGAGTVTISSTSVSLPGALNNLASTAVNPALRGSVSTTVDGASKVQVVGRYAYVVDQSFLKIFDISTSSPSLIGSTSVNPSGSGGSGATEAFTVNGRYAFIVTSADNLKVFDISKPGDPVFVGVENTTYYRSSLYVSGRYAYVANQINDAFHVVDISNPANMYRVSSTSPIGTDPNSVFVSGKYAYVTSSGGGDPRLHIVDISNPASPVVTGSASTGITPSFKGQLSVSGRYAYVLNYTSSNLQIFDLSTSSPALVSTTNTGTNPTTSYLSGRYLYVVNEGGGASNNVLQIFDVSDPSAPVSAGSVTVGQTPVSVYVSGRYAYVLSDTTNTLEVYDIGGLEATSAFVHALESGNVQVRNDVTVGNQLQAGGLTVGANGIISSGPLSVGIASSTQSGALSAFFQGRVGIGTTSPMSQLSIVGDEGLVFQDGSGSLSQIAGGTFGSGGNSKITFRTQDNGGALTARMVIIDDGNVGIGTTTPPATLSINDSSSIDSFRIGSNTPQFIVAKNSNIGIGTTSPSRRLSVVTQTSNDGLRIVRGDNPSTEYFDLYSDAAWAQSGFSLDVAGQKTLFMSAADGDVVIGSLSAGPSSAPASKLTVNGGVNIGFAPNTAAPSSGLLVSGNVAIGTSSPRSALEVTSSSASKLILSDTSTAAGARDYSLATGFNANGTFAILQGASQGSDPGSGSAVLLIDNSGKIGISTTTPGTFEGTAYDSKFHVTGGGMGISYVTPYLLFDAINQSANARLMDLALDNGKLKVRKFDDNGANETALLTIERSSGNVGIGTTSPAALLTLGSGSAGTSILRSYYDGDNPALVNYYADIYHGGDTSGLTLQSRGSATGSGDITFWGGSATPSELMRIKYDGNVGIGTTSPQRKIHVGDSSNDVQLRLGNADRDTAMEMSTAIGSQEVYRLQGGYTFITGSSGISQLNFETSAAGTQMVIDSSGNVGIGTTSPSKLLSVQGDALISGTTTVNGLVATSTVGIGTLNPTDKLQISGGSIVLDNSQGLKFGSGGSPAIFTSNGTNAYVRSPSGSGGFRIQNAAGSVDVFAVTDGGSVGIGTTSPNWPLSIATGASNGINLAGTTNGPFVRFDHTSAQAHVWQLRTTDGDLFQLYDESNARAIWTADGNANFGIGATSPNANLDIEFTDSTAFDATGDTGKQISNGLQIYNLDETANSFAQLTFINRNSAASHTRIASISTGANTADLAISTENGGVLSEKFRLTAAGNVGIGTTSPFTTLAVAGDVTVWNGATQEDLKVYNGAICADNNGSTKCQAALTAGTVYGDASAFAASDLAENYPIFDQSIEAGDIVALSNEISYNQREEKDRIKNGEQEDKKSLEEILTTALVKATPDNQNKIIGAISTLPGVLLGDTTGMTLNTETRPVALSGRIPVKVNLEGGPIQTGDPIAISSTPGVGKKAIKSGMIVGYALENYNGPTAENQGKVLVFANAGYWMSNDFLNQDFSSQIQNNSSLLSLIIDTVKSWLQSMQVTVENGLVKLKDLIANKVTVQQLCVGETCITESELKALLESNAISPSAGSSPLEPTNNQTTESDNQETDTQSPTITLSGPASIQIERGTSWTDPGATVTDNVNDNLGIYYQVNGEDTPNEGRTAPQIDTTQLGAYLITYYSTDQAGNRGEANREVTVYDPNETTQTEEPLVEEETAESAETATEQPSEETTPPADENTTEEELVEEAS